ncbi:MAG TPA: DUF3341 domain-containing protein [Bryobacteraceae bacterium]|nr:DUF3341 domain-containing protein [Bryobacteraceae bacterium]
MTHEHTIREPRVYGLMAEFANPDQLVRAAERAYQEGYRDMDAFAPMPVHGLAEAVGMHSTKVPLVVLIGGLLGACGGFGLCYFMAALAYVHNTGGKPVNSWPAFIPITFEVTVLLASFSAVLGMLIMNGLPRPYHPVFNAPRFSLASDDRFFLCIEAADPKFDLQRTRDLLHSLDAWEVTEVDA